jgi:diaminopimelate epimerase
MSGLKFTKMNGWGNDFVVLEGPIRLGTADIVAMCDRRFGVGADGLLVVSPGRSIGMDYWNGDGSPAEMCGNGLRCVSRYAVDRGWAEAGEFQVRTPMGLRMVSVGETVEVELGPVSITGEIEVDRARYVTVDVGNPHAVAMVAKPEQIEVEAIGSMVESSVPAGTNVEFVALNGSGIKMRVWERGVGETLACGTGMAAAAFVAQREHGLEWPISVTVPGGTGSIDLREGTAYLVGPATYSFEGVWDRPLIGQG